MAFLRSVPLTAQSRRSSERPLVIHFNKRKRKKVEVSLAIELIREHPYGNIYIPACIPFCFSFTSPLSDI